MIVIGRIHIQVQIQSLPQAFALLRGLSLEVMGEFTRLLDEGGDFLLQGFDDLVFAVKNIYEAFELGVLGELFLDLNNLVAAYVVLEELLLVDLDHFLGDELILYGALSVG